MSFRHSGWQLERLRVQHALVAANVAASRRERFAACGCDCVVEFSPSQKRHRLRANYCGDRFCGPCSRARSKKIERALAKEFARVPPLFITLTLRARAAPLPDILDRLYASFKLLRRSAFWRGSVSGGVAVTEVKRGTGSGEWHVHLHILAHGSYLDGRRLSEEWRRVTGDSFIVDVSRVKKDGKGVAYVAKYAGKGWTAEVVRNHDDLVECICALRGRRLLVTFGSMARLDVDGEFADPGDWQRVGRLDHVLREHAAGKVWARGVIVSLGRLDLEEASNLDPPGPE